MILAPLVKTQHNMAADYLPSERELSRSEEEEKLLRDIREEKERLWLEIQVCRRLRLAYSEPLAGFVIQGTCSNNHCTDCLFQELRRQIIDIDNELAALDEANDE